MTFFVTTALFGPEQLLEEITRVTKSSATLLDHIDFIPTINHVYKVKVVESGISDYGVIFCEWAIKLPKQRGHTTITFRSLKLKRNKNFFNDLSLLPFADVYNHRDQEEALSVWCDTIKSVIDKHAPIQRKRRKTTKPCPCLTQELILRNNKKRSTPA